MNGKDIFLGLSHISRKFINEAENDTIPHSSVKQLRRPLLVAAILAMMLLLVGCAVVYMLRLQDMKVGEAQHYTPTYYDKDGNVIPMETRKPITLLSLQGVHMEALAEWVAFTESYDPDLSIAMEADKAGSSDAIPAQYHYTYDCYSQDMVDRLNEIVEKYDLKLLSNEIVFQSWESSVFQGALGIDSLCREGIDAEILSGYFYPEGTFNVSFLVSMEGHQWQCREHPVDLRYSVKDYFDPVVGSVGDPDAYTQWDYTRSDGITVLLAMSDESARIYADLPNAFLSLSMDPYRWEEGGVKIPMTKKGLEEMAEVFDFSIVPGNVDLDKVADLQLEAAARHEADRAAAAEAEQEKYTLGYAGFAQALLERSLHDLESLSYFLHDLNGDGVEEMLVNTGDVLSMKDGESYLYFDCEDALTVFPMLRPCEGNVLKVSTVGVYPGQEHYFYKADAESVSYLVGLRYEESSDSWTLIPDDDAFTENNRVISAEEAQRILDTYPELPYKWRPLKRYGESYQEVTCTDPYAQYIADQLGRYDEAVNYQYALLDLDGDGVQELLTGDTRISTYNQDFRLIRVHTIRDGKLVTMAENGFAFVCAGGILEYSEEIFERDAYVPYHEYYRYENGELVFLERVFQERGMDVWYHVSSDGEGQYLTEADAQPIIGAYSRIDVDWKPFGEYPLK